jgi:hypothetical protein
VVREGPSLRRVAAVHDQALPRHPRRDLSYRCLAQAAPQIEAVAIADAADLVALVKPMYELGLARPPATRTREPRPSRRPPRCSREPAGTHRGRSSAPSWDGAAPSSTSCTSAEAARYVYRGTRDPSHVPDSWHA